MYQNFSIDASLPIYMVSAADLETVVRRLIKEENDRHDAERNTRTVRTSEVMERLNVDASTLYRWRKAGKIKGVRTGREIVYREQDILRLMEG